MSRLSELIAELCPNGVKTIRLSELCDIKNGYTPSKSVYEYWNGDTTVPWFRMEDIRANGHILSDSIQHVTKDAVKNGKLFPKNSIILATTATIGEHALITADSLANQRFTYLTIREPLRQLMDAKFFYYYMYVVDEWCKKNVNVSGFASVNMDGLKKLEIPLPPLKIQQEIVKILDKFTQLQAELQAELELRSKQYGHYRNELLSFANGLASSRIKRLIDELCPNGVEYVPIWKVTAWDKKFNAVENYKQAKVVKYQYLLAKELRSLAVDGGDVKLLSTGDDSYGYTTEEIGGDLVSEGEIVAIPWGCNANIQYYKGKFITSDNRIATSLDTNVLDNKFLYYCMLNKQAEIATYYRGSGIKHPSMRKVLDMEIPLPPIKVQCAIGGILDKFSSLVSGISDGLPAEIKLRQQQYEYYRDKLLTFNPAN